MSIRLRRTFITSLAVLVIGALTPSPARADCASGIAGAFTCPSSPSAWQSSLDSLLAAIKGGCSGVTSDEALAAICAYLHKCGLHPDCAALTSWAQSASWPTTLTPAQLQAFRDCSGCAPDCGDSSGVPDCPDGMDHVHAAQSCEKLRAVLDNVIMCFRASGVSDEAKLKQRIKDTVCKFFKSTGDGGCWNDLDSDAQPNPKPCLNDILKCLLTIIGPELLDAEMICGLYECIPVQAPCFDIFNDCEAPDKCRPCFHGPNASAMCDLVASAGDLCMQLHFLVELAEAPFACSGGKCSAPADMNAYLRAVICDYLKNCIFSSKKEDAPTCTQILACLVGVFNPADCVDLCDLLKCATDNKGCGECDSLSSEGPFPPCPTSYDDLYALLQVARCCDGAPSGSDGSAVTAWANIICRWADHWGSTCPNLSCADIAQAVFDAFFCVDGTGDFARLLNEALSSHSNCFKCAGDWPRHLVKGSGTCASLQSAKLIAPTFMPEPNAPAVGPEPKWYMPVDLAYGHKTESATDLMVALPGGDFALTRSYTSETGGKGPVGYGWTFSALRTIVETSNPDVLYLDGPGADQRMRFTRPTSGTSWLADAPMQQVITKVTSATWNGDTVYFWRLSSPGQGYSDFLTKDSPHFAWAGGVLARETNAYGRIDEYEYVLTKFKPYLKEIQLGLASGTPMARVQFTWNLSGVLMGTVARVEVARQLSSTWYITDRIEYTYLDKVGTTNQFGNAQLGSPGDLVQVIVGERTDSAALGLAIFRERITHYRYHDGSSVGTGDERLQRAGAAHQLKLVIDPEQVEYCADQKNRSLYGPVLPAAAALRAGANTLLTQADSAVAFVEASSNVCVIDLASKIVKYGTDERVTDEFVQSSCGCAGAGQGVKMSFAFASNGTTSTAATYCRATVTEYEQTSLGNYATAFRLSRFEMKILDDTPFLIVKAVGTASSLGTSGTFTNGWIWANKYNDGTGGDLTLLADFAPSAIASFTPSYGSGTGYSLPSFSVNSSTGLVRAYAYTTTGDHRLTETWVGSGNVTSMPPSSGFKILEKTEYGSYDASLRPNEREYLPKSIKRCRTGSTSDLTTANDNEEMTFAYTFHTSAGENIASVKRTAERELTGENGPGGTVDSWELYDTSGQNVHSRDEVLAVTTRTFDSTTGRLASVKRNDATAPTGSSFGGITTTGWGGLTGGELTTTYTRDLLGRIISVTSPGLGSGITTYTAREMRDDLTDTGQATGSPSSASRGVTTYAETALPHKLTSSGPYNGPATVQWENAGGSTLCAMDFEVTYAPSAYLGYTLGTTLAKSTKTLAYTGVTKSTQAWSKVSGSADVITTYDYDQRGRVASVTQPSGTVVAYTYGGVSDRVLIVKVGDGSSTPATVADYAYDSTSFSSISAQEGFGDGNLRVVRQYTATSTTRDTTYYYDERDRKYLTTGPVTPYDAVSYDNLNRMTRRGLLKAAPSTITPANVDSALSGTTNTDRGLLTVTSYSQRGMVHKSETAIDPANLATGYLASHSFFDGAGRTIGSARPAAPTVKRVLDGHGRVTTSYVTDRKGDDDASSGDRFSEWTGVTATGSGSADNVLEQTTTTYSTTTGMPDLVTTIQRWHNSSTTGALGHTTGVATYVAYRYDEANRLTHTVNFGTNRSDNIFGIGGTGPTTWPLTSNAVPTYSTSGLADTIITETKYNTRGLVSESVDGEGRRAATFYDDLSRPYATVENYNGSGSFSIAWSSTYSRWSVTYPSSNADDVNRTTTTVYDAAGRAIKLVAHAPNGTGETVQETAYDYGVITSGAMASSLATKDLLAAVRYPDRSTGDAGTGTADKVLYSYNHAGELVSVKDQNTTQHDYTRDTAGRVTLDSVASFGTNIDNAVKSISVTYDDYGRLGRVRSHSVANPSPLTSNIVNAVEYGYTPLWQVRDVYQNNGGDVTLSGTTPTGSTRTTMYEYETVEDGSSSSPRNYSRQLKMYYPTMGHVKLLYSTSTTIGNRISRPYSIQQDSWNTFATYAYIGVNTPSSVNYPAINVQLDRTLTHDGKRRFGSYTSQTAGDYPCLDRFGRVVRQVWAHGVLTTNSGSTSVPNISPLVELSHTYDKNSNRLTRIDERPGATVAARDWQYTYDGLDRLKQADKGHRGTSSFVLDTGTQAWVLDALGNWTSFKEDLSGNGAFETAEIEARTHNAANELTQRTPGGGSSLPLQYDDAGNMKWNKYTTAGGGSGYTLVHDAWNRLVKVLVQSSYNPSSGGFTVLTNTYNGLHWRVKSEEDVQTVPNGTLLTTDYLYDASWRVIEERVTDGGATDFTYAEYWGLRYIDDAVMRVGYDNYYGQSTFWHHLTDAQFSTVALLDEYGTIRERISYDPYGKARHRWGYDADGDGDVDNNDYLRVLLTTLTSPGNPPITDPAYDPDCDLNYDGVVDSADVAIANTSANWRSALPSGWISEGDVDPNPPTMFPNGPRNPFGYCGYMLNPNSELYTVRFRHYAPNLGRWVERDPVEYLGASLNTYEYVLSRPTCFVDSLGLAPKDNWYDIPMELKDSGFGEYIEGCKGNEGRPPNKNYTRKELWDKLGAWAETSEGRAAWKSLTEEQQRRLAPKLESKGIKFAVLGFILFAVSQYELAQEAAAMVTDPQAPCYQFFKRLSQAAKSKHCNEADLKKWHEECKQDASSRGAKAFQGVQSSSAALLTQAYLDQLWTRVQEACTLHNATTTCKNPAKTCPKK